MAAVSLKTQASSVQGAFGVPFGSAVICLWVAGSRITHVSRYWSWIDRLAQTRYRPAWRLQERTMMGFSRGLLETQMHDT